MPSLRFLLSLHLIALTLFCSQTSDAQEKLSTSPAIQFGPYEYESKPDDKEFAKFFPRKAPPIGNLLIQPGDRLAIIGDSITEQKMYSRIIETYLTVCVPDMQITVRQFGWSGEKADGFLRRMDNDCLRFAPTLATLCYGMNDARYRPFDVTNGQWYRDHYTAVVRKLKDAGARVVLGSPGCSGKIASWVKSRSGTLDEHNLNLCALRDICIDIAQKENVRFADQFWPMYQQQVYAARKYGSPETPYRVAGKDGIHPGWAGHVMMAFAFLESMGLDGDLGTIHLDWASAKATASNGHSVNSFADGSIVLTSTRYPFCARGDVDSDTSIRSGMTLVPFMDKLNRLTLKVSGIPSKHAEVSWGEGSKKFSSDELANGINLADHFAENPFCTSFDQVDQAVAAKQAFETHQIKRVFHGKAGKTDIEKAVAETEARRKSLADKIKQNFKPVSHTIKILPIH